jgi:GNAT superfamily N-acetyltransferase
MYSISACKTPKEKKLFERLAESLHGKDPAFIPPFPGSIVKYLSPKSAFCRAHGEIHPFLAWRDGRPVGRIAAIINRSHNTYHHDKAGFFGFFECEDNGETAAALFAHVENFLAERGFTSVRGPYSPSINDECGLLVEGFDIPPVTGLIWNPRFYERLVLSAGYAPARSVHCFLLPMHRLEPPARLARIVAHLSRRGKMKLRPIRMDDLPNEMKIIQEVYNATLERNWGFVPISLEDLLSAADDIKAIADPELLLIAEINGENAGVALTLPDFNQILARTKNTPHWLRLPHILWLMKTRRVTACRQTVLGVSPRFRDRGLHAWLIHSQFDVARQRHANATLGWVDESNTEVLEVCEISGGIRDRTWRLFEKSLTVA